MSVNEVKIQPAPFELEVRGTGHPSSRTYAIGDEDHTLGNALRHVLMQNAKVEFAGYSVPHPSEPVVQIRVQTARKSKVLYNMQQFKLREQQQQQQEEEEADSNDNDGDENYNDRLHATVALKEACETLIDQCDIVLDQVEELMPEVRQDRIDLEDHLRNEGYGEDDEEMVDEYGDDIRGGGEEGNYDDDMM